MTFEEVLVLEPRLKELYDEAKANKPTDEFCELAAWFGWGDYRGFKRRLLLLVGWDTPLNAPGALRTHEAYDVAYQTILHALPPCGRLCPWHGEHDNARP